MAEVTTDLRGLRAAQVHTRYCQYGHMEETHFTIDANVKTASSTTLSTDERIVVFGTIVSVDQVRSYIGEKIC